MNVQFPGLGWSFTINSTAFSIGSFDIKWYGIIIGMGFGCGVLYAMLYMAKKMNIDRDALLTVVIIGLIAGIIGARLYYVIFYPGTRYWETPWLVFDIRDGGLGIYGGIICAFVAGGIAAKLSKLNVYSVFDLAALGFLIGQAFGRWGNFMNQEAFGGRTSLPWGMVSEKTGFVPVHPCFFYESLWCVLGFVLLHFFTLKLRKYDGQTFLLYCIWYGTGRFFIEALRSDSLYIPGMPIKVSQAVAVIAVVASIVLLIVFRNRTKLAGCGLRSVMAINAEQMPIHGEPSPVMDDYSFKDAWKDEKIRKKPKPTGEAVDGKGSGAAVGAAVAAGVISENQAETPVKPISEAAAASPLRQDTVTLSVTELEARLLELSEEESKQNLAEKQAHEVLLTEENTVIEGIEKTEENKEEQAKIEDVKEELVLDVIGEDRVEPQKGENTNGKTN